MCHLRMAVIHLPITFVQIALSNSELLTIFEIQGGGRRHLGFSSNVNLAHSVMLIVWCLSSLSNLIHISVIVIEIDALILHMFI